MQAGRHAVWRRPSSLGARSGGRGEDGIRESYFSELKKAGPPIRVRLQQTGKAKKARLATR